MVRFLHFLLLLAVAIGAFAVPLEINSAVDTATPTSNPAVADDNASRYRCGSMKFDDGTTQDMVSQVWSGHPFDEIYCHPIKYTRARKDKGGQDANMVAAKIDNGCTCCLYESACDPKKGHSEEWDGWVGWDNYAYTDKHFKYWWCYESF